jgi:hypothetical protein
MKRHSDSFSKKGYGNGFVSKSKRFGDSLDRNSIDYMYTMMKATPGPGHYYS